jgi:hypothetical protein
MLRSSTIIVIIKIMVELLKMSLLLWNFSGCKDGNGVVPGTCHHTETLFNSGTVIRMRMPKVLVRLVPATGLTGFSKEWRGIALHLGDKSRA